MQMNGTLAVRSVIDGRLFVSMGMSPRWATEVLKDVLRIPGTTVADVIDVLPWLQRDFPLGGRVMLGPRVYWNRGARGTVTEDKPESFAAWPEPPEVTPWCIGHSGAYVSVLLDGDKEPSWWSARWLERI